MTFLFFLASTVLVAGFALIAHGLLTAPEGYEDERGFHVLTRKEMRETRTQMELSLGDRPAEIAIAPAGMALHP